MRIYTKRLIWSGTMGVLAAGMVWGATTLWAAAENGHASKRPAPKFVTADSSPAPEAKITTSYAPIVKQAAPAVVNVSTTKTVKNQVMQFFPFQGDPLFQQFFGVPHRGMPQTRQFKEHSLGSGVIVTKDGYILTNNHVVDGADEIKVSLANNKEDYDATVVGRDPRADIAVLKIDAKNLPVAVLGNSDKLQVGDVVLAIGDPFGVGQTVTSGIVSALGRGGMGIEDYEDFIQTDAPINPGNSGGALVDAQGHLVGINTAILSRSGGSMGIGFAIPVNEAKNIMNQLIETGHVERGYLGIMIQDLNDDLAKQFDAPSTKGALVSDVTSGSAADKAGLKSGDVITQVNGKPVNSSRQLKLLIGSLTPGTKIKMTVYRDGDEETLTARLKELPEKDVAMSRSQQNNEKSDALDGVTVSDLTPQARQQFDVPKDVEGALIVNVDPSSPSYDAGLRPGDVIEQINNKTVDDADQAVDISNHIKPDRVLVKVWSHGGSHFTVVKDEGKVS